MTRAWTMPAPWTSASPRSKFLALLLILFMLTLTLLRLPTPTWTGSTKTNALSQCHKECVKRSESEMPLLQQVDEEGVSARNTTCSYEVYKRRGRHQKVIAFTYFENLTYDIYNRDYFRGIEANLEAMSLLYPDFVMRLYYSVQSSLTRSRLCELSCKYSHLDLCDVSENPKYGNASILYPLVWRFMPVVDWQVDLVLVRDLDSRLTHRERVAVAEFEAEDAAMVHVMRDHPQHDLGMLGGTWGAKLSDEIVRHKWRRSFLNMHRNMAAYSERTKAGVDQLLLNRYAYTWAKHVMLAHDSYFCTHYKGSVSFPTRRESGLFNFVGAVVDKWKAQIDLQDPKDQCPLPCRRNHTWTHC